MPDHEPSALSLCLIDPPWAWFTSLPVEDEWGEDWDSEPYQTNAGAPYEKEGVTHKKIAFDGPLFPPGDGPRQEIDGIESVGVDGNFVSVADINHERSDIPWLIETGYSEMYGEVGVEIDAGTSLPEFKALVANAGGTVYDAVATGSETQQEAAPDTSDTGNEGLYQKYEVYRDGDPVPNCFVLEPDRDETAREAIRAYAEETTDKELSRDLMDWMDSYTDTVGVEDV